MRRCFFLLVKLLISAGLIFFLYRNTPMQQIREALHGLRPVYFVLIVMLLFANTLISAKKWQLFLSADGIVISLFDLTISYMSGTFCSLFLPSNIGGDSYRIYDIAKRSSSGVRSAASVFADRFSGFIALVSLSLLSSVFVAFRFQSMCFVFIPLLLLLAFLSILYLITNPSLFNVLLTMTRLKRIGFVDRFAGRLLDSFACYWQDKMLLLWVMLLSFAFQFFVILVVFLLACSLGMAIPLLYFGAFVPMITLMEALPISIYGIGVRDYGYVFFFTQVGMGDIESRTLALLFMTVSICYSLIGGGCFLYRLWQRPQSS